MSDLRAALAELIAMEKDWRDSRSDVFLDKAQEFIATHGPELAAALADLTSDEWWRKQDTEFLPLECAEIVRERLKDSRDRPAPSSQPKENLDER